MESLNLRRCQTLIFVILFIKILPVKSVIMRFQYDRPGRSGLHLSSMTHISTDSLSRWMDLLPAIYLITNKYIQQITSIIVYN